MKKKIFFIILTLVTVIIFTGCTKEEKIELNYESSSIELTVGDEINVKPNVKSENIDNFTLEYSLSSDIASIDNEGILKALKEGELILTVSVKEYSNVSVTLKIAIKEQPKNEYTISYDLDGGLFNEEIKTSFLEDEIVVLPSPLKEGYKFLGWYENNILINTIENKNYSLVAKWEVIKYSVTYKLNGGVNNKSNPTTYTILDSITLQNPTKDGYIFKGWNEGNTIVKGSTGNKTFTANWEKEPAKEVTVTYVLDENTYLLKYNSREELINELISDIKAVKGSTYDLAFFNAHTSSGYNIFAGTSGASTFFANDAMRTKWTWLLEYMKETRTASELDVAQYDGLIQNGYVDADAATINLEMIGFICGKKSTYTSGTVSFESSNYGNYNIANSYRKVFHDEYLKNNTFTSGTKLLDVLPNVLKEGSNFLGWYTSSDFSESSKVTSNTILSSDVKVYPKFELSSNYVTALFDFNGGVINELYLKYGTKLTSIKVNSYNGAFWTESASIYYKNGIFVSTKANDPKATFSSRVYIAKNKYTGLYEIVSLLASGTKSSWPEDAEYVITLSTSYSGSYDDNFSFSSLKVGSVVVFDTTIENISSSNVANVYFFDGDLSNDELTLELDEEFSMPEPNRLGYMFIGWYDDDNNKYETKEDITKFVRLTAKWEARTPVTDIIVEGIPDKILAGNTYKLSAHVEPSDAFFQTIYYSSSNTKIFTISDNGILTAIIPGTAELVVKDYMGAVVKKFTIVVDSEPCIVGEFENNSWVVTGDKIKLVAQTKGYTGNLVWSSNTPEIATVNQNGEVTGVTEGIATIVVKDENNDDINFIFYVTVLNTTPTEILKLIVDSNNANIFTRKDLIIGIISSAGYYYSDVVESVSKLLFEEYQVNESYYLSNPNNTTTLSSGVEFITFHYAADMTGNATNGGKNLAVYNQTLNKKYAEGNKSYAASYHYAVGNDGIWHCQNENKGAWHAGASKTMTWTATGISYKPNDPEFAKITLGSDGYFYLNGLKTKIKNTTSSTNLNKMGLAFKVQGGEYYLGGHYYNSTYKYIASTGGNNNSIGIESSCAKNSDLWLTWQYSSQLCAKLLLKYDLPLTRLVGHHFFAGKWCPQPMLENDLEIWWEFVELVRQEMDYYKNYSNYTLTFKSDSSYLDDNGRIISLPLYSECVTYTVTYNDGTTTKEVTLSSIIPGTVA